jgi:hypothetical protein
MRNHALLLALSSVVTSPFLVVSMSMQMSVMPNLTIYGDVRPEEINKGLLSQKIGLPTLQNRKAISTSEKQLIKVTEDAVAKFKSPEPRADLMKLSG